MDLSRRRMLQIGAAGTVLSACPVLAESRSPAPFGALPSARQLAWHDLETYGFIHFSVNTFTDREWGYGDESPAIFNPTDFSADQIASVAKAGGLKQLILTAKHHDGFCLWPSAFTEHSIKNSPYKDGKGDIVREMAEACARHDLKFGVYLSPWDRNHPEYGRPAYVTYYLNQLHELLTGYGKLYEVWFDGANGGDGYYGGARETRHIDAATYYQWDTVRASVRTHQPDAVMFADAHMDVRWVGNERGIAGDPCWPTMDDKPYTEARGNSGVRGGPIWDPAECDVSIRPGWFWHADENDKVRSPANLLQLYLDSTGRGANLLLNVPPNRRGQIEDADAAALKGFRAILDQAYAHNLADGARATASSQFGPNTAAAQVLKTGGYWAAREDDRDGAWLRLDLPREQSFDLIRLREVLDLGVRVDDIVIETLTDGQWRELSRHTGIGHQRLIRLKEPVSTKSVRVRFVQPSASPVLREFSLYRLPDLLEAPDIRRDKEGVVQLTAASDAKIYYSLDGSAPNVPYTAPIPLADGGTIKAVARKGATESAIATADFDLAPVGWRISSDQGNADILIGQAGGWDRPSFTGAPHQPVDLVLDLGQTRTLTGFTVLPASQNPYDAGPPAGYTAWISDDGVTWQTPVAQGEFSNIAANRSLQKVRFSAPHSGRYLKLSLTRAVQDKAIIALSGIGVLTK